MASVTIKLSEQDLEVFVRWAQHLRRVDRFHLPEADEALVERIVTYSIQNRESSIEVGESLYRARVNKIDEPRAKQLSEMGAPPRDSARAGRMNPTGIPYLYVALDAATAIAEVRPWKGALISVARFVPHRVLRVVNLNYRDIKPPGKQSKRATRPTT